LDWHAQAQDIGALLQGAEAKTIKDDGDKAAKARKNCRECVEFGSYGHAHGHGHEQKRNVARILNRIAKPYDGHSADQGKGPRYIGTNYDYDQGNGEADKHDRLGK